MVDFGALTTKSKLGYCHALCSHRKELETSPVNQLQDLSLQPGSDPRVPNQKQSAFRGDQIGGRWPYGIFDSGFAAMSRFLSLSSLLSLHFLISTLFLILRTNILFPIFRNALRCFPHGLPSCRVGRCGPLLEADHRSAALTRL
jgi:hypothetical protein